MPVKTGSFGSTTSTQSVDDPLGGAGGGIDTGVGGARGSGGRGGRFGGGGSVGTTGPKSGIPTFTGLGSRGSGTPGAGTWSGRSDDPTSGASSGAKPSVGSPRSSGVEQAAAAPNITMTSSPSTPPAVDYVNVSTPISSNAVQVGLSPQRPEILGVFDFPACFKNSQPTAAAQLLDVQFQYKQSGYTTVASMIGPYIEGLEGFKNSFDEIKSDNEDILSVYESLLPSLQALFDALNFSTGNSRRNSTVVASSYITGDQVLGRSKGSTSQYTDVYNIVSNKSLQNFLQDICKLDRRFVSGLSNTAAYMQCCIEFSNLVRYGLIPDGYRQFTTTDGFSTVGTTYGSEYSGIIEGLTTVSSTSSLTSSQVSSAKNKISKIMSGDLSKIHSIIYRNSCCQRLITKYSRYTDINDLVTSLIIDYSPGDVIGQSGTRSSISSRAFARTVAGSKLYLPLETKYVTADSQEVETGRKVLIDSLVSSLVTAGTTLGSDIAAYADFVDDILSNSDPDFNGLDTLPIDLVPKIYTELDVTYIPRSIAPMSSCLVQFNAMLSAAGIAGGRSSYDDIFMLNILSLAKTDSDLLFRLSRFICARARVNEFFDDASPADLSRASSAKNQALSSLIDYILNMSGVIGTKTKDMNVRSRSSSGLDIGSGTGSINGSSISARDFLTRAIDRDSGPLTYILGAVSDYVNTLNYRFGSINPYDTTGRADGINVDSIITAFTLTFAYFARSGITIEIRSSNGRSAQSFFQKQSNSFNTYVYYKSEAGWLSSACTALLQYKTNASLSTKLSELITVSAGLQYGRAFTDSVQVHIDKLLTEESAIGYLGATFKGFCYGVVEARARIDSWISSLNSGSRSGGRATVSDLLISDQTTGVRRIPVPVYDLDYFVSSFSVDQLLTSIAMNRLSSKVSLDHPAFPVSKTLDANELHNLKIYLTNLGSRLSSSPDRNRILAVGIPAGMLTLLRDQTRQKATFTSPDEIAGNDGPFRIVVRVMARNQRKDSDPVVVADFTFDTRIFALGGTESGDYTVKNFNNLAELYKGTPFYKVSGVNRVERIDPSRSNISYLINHFNDHYCKIFLRAMTGIDLSEQNFTFDKTVTKYSPDLTKVDTFNRMLEILTARFPQLAGSQNFRDAIGRTIYFNEYLYRTRPIYTRMFDRIFCIPINLDSFGLAGKNAGEEVDMKDLFCVVTMDTVPQAVEEPPPEITVTIPAESDVSSEIKDEALDGFYDSDSGRLGNVTVGGDTGTATPGDVNIRSGIEASVDVSAQTQAYIENSVLGSMIKDVTQNMINESLDRGAEMLVQPVVSVNSLDMIKNEIVVGNVTANIAVQATRDMVSTDFISSQAKPFSNTNPVRQVEVVNQPVQTVKNIETVSPSVQSIKNVTQANTNLVSTPAVDAVRSSVVAQTQNVVDVRTSNYQNAMTSNYVAARVEVATLATSVSKSVEVSKQIEVQNNVTATKQVTTRASAAKSTRSSASASASAKDARTAVQSQSATQSNLASNVATSSTANTAANSAAATAANSAASSAAKSVTKSAASSKTYTSRRK